ncbi:MAG: hypothetical protein VKI81_12260 [Synechococcaceae cyanobacterium]|nr:hypothetical protein [Synechococcaceae cyanobacterium]
MLHRLLAAPLLIALAFPLEAQQAEREPPESPVYYGGSVILGFGSAFRIGLYPLVGVRVAPKLSVGAQVGYEYVDYSGPGGSTSMYGGSLFTRYRILPAFYLHGEGRAINYERFLIDAGSERQWVPLVLLGGGFVQRISRRASAYVEVLFDVLNDDKSPYDDWVPFVRVGFGVGF